MKGEIEYYFYALLVNGHTISVHATYEEAIRELTERITQDDKVTYGIECVEGIWELIQRLGRFENFGDEWMEDVLYKAHAMIERKKELAEKTTKKQDKK